MKIVSFLVVAVVATATFLMTSDGALAQPPGGFRGRGGFGGGPGGPGGPFGGGGGGTLGLLQQQEVQQEIELTDEQKTELRQLGETLREQVGNEMRGMFEGMRDLSDEERRARFAEIRTKFEEINKESEAQMQKVLLPHQFERIKQIELQSRLQRGGANALTDGELAETLGLTDEQRDQIREKSEAVQKDLNEKIAQLRVDARKQLLEVLTPEQRAKLESMMGSDFTLPEQQFGPPGGGGPGGRGGRGFGRGGRDRDRNRGGGSAPAAENDSI